MVENKQMNRPTPERELLRGAERMGTETRRGDKAELFDEEKPATRSRDEDEGRSPAEPVIRRPWRRAEDSW